MHTTPTLWYKLFLTQRRTNRIQKKTSPTPVKETETKTEVRKSKLGDKKGIYSSDVNLAA